LSSRAKPTGAREGPRVRLKTACRFQHPNARDRAAGQHRA
jgi:hypothetical protein